MKVRAHSVLIAGVLFTVALLSLIPWSLANALTGRNKMALDTLDAGFRAVARMTGDLGVICLAMILIGLIVTWTGYIKQARSAWAVMFVLTWAWAFPLFVLPWFTAHRVIAIPELLYGAIYESGIPRLVVESVLIFLLMVIALLLPLRSFFGRGTAGAAHAPSPKLFAVSVATLLVLVIALLFWVHTRVYEIPPEMLKLWQQMPPPPPPPRQ